MFIEDQVQIHTQKEKLIRIRNLLHTFETLPFKNFKKGGILVAKSASYPFLWIYKELQHFARNLILTLGRYIKSRRWQTLLCKEKMGNKKISPGKKQSSPMGERVGNRQPKIIGGIRSIFGRIQIFFHIKHISSDI